MRAIDADNLIGIFSNLSEYDKYTAVFIDQIIKIINGQPTVKSEKCVAEVSISKEQLEAIITPQIEELKHFLSGWIPVDERLPEGKPFDSFLVCYENGAVSTEALWCICDFDYNEHIVAWMPLPEPYYKGMKHEEDN